MSDSPAAPATTVDAVDEPIPQPPWRWITGDGFGAGGDATAICSLSDAIRLLSAIRVSLEGVGDRVG